jgi:hypothetical protein
MDAPSDTLRVTDVPLRGASWEQVVAFANLVERFLPSKCSELARNVNDIYRDSGRWQGTLSELLSSLYLQHRTFHHWGRQPEGEELSQIYDLLHAIRIKVIFPPRSKLGPTGAV